MDRYTRYMAVILVILVAIVLPAPHAAIGESTLLIWTGSSHQLDFMHTLESLAKLPYVQRIDAVDFE